jgi:hypothetical protein
MVGVDQLHRNQCEVVAGCNREEHQHFGHQPIAAFHRRGEDAFDESICARTRDRTRRERNERQRDQPVSHDAVAVEPSVLRTNGREAADC